MQPIQSLQSGFRAVMAAMLATSTIAMPLVAAAKGRQPGDLIGPQISVPTPPVVQPTDEIQIARNSQGLTAVCWLDGQAAYEPSTARVAVYSPDGELLLSPLVVSEAAQFYCRVALSDQGEILVAWSDGNGGEGTLIRRLDTEGNFRSEATVLPRSGGVAQATALKSGDFVVTDVDEQAGFDEDDNLPSAAYWRIAAAGGQITGPFQVTTTSLGTDLPDAIQGAPDGGFLVVWSSGKKDSSGAALYGRKFKADGQAATPPFLVRAVEKFATGASGAADNGSNRIAVCWTGQIAENSPGAAYTRLFDQTGQAVTPAWRMTDGTFLPVPALDRAGNLAVAYEGIVSNPGGRRVSLSRYDSEGRSLGPISFLNETKGKSFQSVQLAPDADGDLVAFWSSSPDIDPYSFYGRRIVGAEPVDSAIAISGVGEAVSAGSIVSAQVSVSNLHVVESNPDIGVADGAVVDITIPVGFALASFDAPDWICSPGAVLSCRHRGVMRAGVQSVLRVDLQAPQDPCLPSALRAELSTDQFDPSIDNDRAEQPFISGVPGTIAWQTDQLSLSEGATATAVVAVRSQGCMGAISAHYALDATDRESANEGVLNWLNGDAAAKSFILQNENDDVDRDVLSRYARLDSASGGATLGAPTVLRLDYLDDDTAGLNFQPSSGIELREGGATATYQLALTTRPLSAVELRVAADALEITPAVLSFDDSNWSIPQQVSLAARNTNAQGSRMVVLAHAVNGSDAKYRFRQDTTVTVRGIESVGGGMSLVLLCPLGAIAMLRRGAVGRRQPA